MRELAGTEENPFLGWESVALHSSWEEEDRQGRGSLTVKQVVGFRE